MNVQLLIPSRKQERIQVAIEKEETVASFRKRVAIETNIPVKSFYLIALGKILLDKCADGKTPAHLFSTYSIRNQTCIFVHVRPQITEEKPQQDIGKATKKKIVRVSHNAIIEPFGGFVCDLCHNDDSKRECKECGCQACHKKTGNPLICDQCDGYWHNACAGLDRFPTDEFWYCPDCVNQDTSIIVGKGKAMETNSKRKYLAYTNMENESAVVSKTHVGKIPGIYCGQSWRGRRECSEWGVHRPTVSTIGGSNKTGAVSIVFSLKSTHGYDKGYEFQFAGSGGCTEGDRYTSLQTADQELTRFNLSLALTCDAPIDAVNGAVAHDWKKSRPVRVCRAAAGDPQFRTQFTPLTGIRYDGLYKVVKYWPEKTNKSKYIIWKFLLRRDDNEAPPWMSYGKLMIKRRGLRTIGCEKENNNSDQNQKQKLIVYKVPANALKLIESDTLNKRMWDEVLKQEFYSKYEFLQYVFDKAIVCTSGACSRPIEEPVATSCGHICCLKCLKQSGTRSCFVCRTEMSEVKVNERLVEVLKFLNKAYGKQTPIRIPALNPSKKRALPDKFEDEKKKNKKRVVVVVEANCEL